MSCALEISHMADVQSVEAAVRKYHALPFPLMLGNDLAQSFAGHDLGFSAAHCLRSPLLPLLGGCLREAPHGTPWPCRASSPPSRLQCSRGVPLPRVTRPMPMPA